MDKTRTLTIALAKTFLSGLTISAHGIRVIPRGEELWHVLVDQLQHLGHVVIGALVERERSVGDHLVVAVHLYINILGDGVT